MSCCFDLPELVNNVKEIAFGEKRRRDVSQSMMQTSTSINHINKNS